MKKFLAMLIAAFTILVFGQASAATGVFGADSLQQLSQPMICGSHGGEGEKKKKKGEDEEEPECD